MPERHPTMPPSGKRFGSKSRSWRNSSGYAHALQTPVWNDVKKLASDPTIVHGLVVLVLFTADATTADHDLDVWRSRARERGLHLWPPAQRSLPISDRVGNRLCTVALFPVDPS